MKFTLRTSPITIFCVSLACAAALAQVQTSPSGPVHSRFGFPMSRMKAQPTAAENHQAQSPSSPDISFTFEMVDVPGQPASSASGVNDKREIVGGYGSAFDSAFFLKGTKFTQIAYPGAAYTAAYAINNAGAIVGQYGVSLTDVQGFKLDGKTYTSIDYPGGVQSYSNGINKHGDIVGGWVDTSGMYHGFLLSKGVFTSIDAPGATGTDALGINAAGEIVGAYARSDGTSHGFLLQSGSFTTIDYPGGYSQNYLGDINDKGVIVGGYGDNTIVNGVAYATEHAFIYESGQFTNADVPFGPPAVTQPYQINNNGVMVGDYVDNSGTVYGYEAAVGP
jgi:probable HAF family extracellular repeat protein